MMHTVKPYTQSLLNQLEKRVEDFGPQYQTYGVFGMANAIFFYPFWTYISPESYENFSLRLVCLGLCALLALHRRWPESYRPWLPLYWYVTLLLTLPTFFTFMLVSNHGSLMWSSNTIMIVLFMLLLVDVGSAVCLLLLGTLIGGIGAYYWHPKPMLFTPTAPTFNYVGFIVTYSWAIIIGAIFSRNRQAIQKFKQKSIRIQAECEEKTAFIANLSHDLRTPLSGLVSLAELENRRLANDHPLKSVFEIIQHSANQLHRLFESMIEAVRFKHGLLLDNPEVFFIETLMQNIVALCQPAILSRSLTCHIMPLPSVLHQPSRGYPHSIEKVLMHLVNNAIEYTLPGGEITLSCQLTTESKNASCPYCAIAVTDTGIGISQSDQAMIFKSFKRVVPAYKQSEAGGCGLGLYTAQKIAKLLNGAITVYSEGENRGSTFTFRFPINQKEGENKTC